MIAREKELFFFLSCTTNSEEINKLKNNKKGNPSVKGAKNTLTTTHFINIREV
jgi:hypothetical protein